MLFTWDENLLLIELERKPTLQDLSNKLQKDASVISRDLKRISEKAPVIEKINGRWVLTEKGSHLALWAKKVRIEQNEILGRDYTLTIATTREFASRILAKNFSVLQNNKVKFKIITCENGIESPLLKGIADFGFDCGRPSDPLVAFKQIIEEEIVTVASPKFIKINKIKSIDDLIAEQFLDYSRLSSNKIKNMDTSKSAISSNDIAVIRSLVAQDAGWATLPYYAIKEEIDQKKMVMFKDGDIKGYKFGVWWLRGRDSLMPWIKVAGEWLSQQNLKV